MFNSGLVTYLIAKYTNATGRAYLVWSKPYSSCEHVTHIFLLIYINLQNITYLSGLAVIKWTPMCMEWKFVFNGWETAIKALRKMRNKKCFSFSFIQRKDEIGLFKTIRNFGMIKCCLANISIPRYFQGT